ncbi:energy transducer TonB [Tellurirhabdus bombi]|uniref:energy transducer TonB n=1 Tax=Tellurirhabdus bombi TaxID=2907205 RepID=UPI001F1BCDA6|nr:energy transducer TonB [Tellurirhabdus bombi]
MATNQWKFASLDDIVFEHRNKAYGAYDLRQHYGRHTRTALWMGIVLFVGALAIPSLIDQLKPAEQEVYMDEVKFEQLPPPEKTETPPIVTPPPAQQVEVPQVRDLPPLVTAEAPDETTVPTVDDLEKAAPSDKTVEGDPNAGEMIEAPSTAAGPTVVEKAIEVEKKEEEPLLFVEQQPEFPGGPAAMYEWLSKNMKYPPAAARSNISGKVYLSFVVNADGSIVDEQVTKGIGFGCDEEALRVVKKMPKWRPGKQSGRPVRVKFNLPIVFALE